MTDGVFPYRLRAGYSVTVGGATVFVVDVDQFVRL